MGRISHVADYIFPGKEILGLNGRLTCYAPGDGDFQGRDFAIFLPSGAVVDEPSILAYLADPSNDADHLTYQVDLIQWPAGQETKTIDIGGGMFTGGVQRGLWTLIPGGLLLPDSGLSVAFHVTGGHGSVAFSRIVLWFQRKVAEAPEE